MQTFTITRTQYPFDLSGVKYKSRSEIFTLQRQWDTFERVENYNDIIFQRLSIGLRDQTYYQFRVSEEMNDYRTGQKNHILRYPQLPTGTFDSISLQDVPYVSTFLSAPPNYTIGMTRGVVFSTTMTSSEYMSQKSDQAIYIHVSTYNQQHKYQYIFPSNEEKMAYHRAERIILADM